MADTCRLHSQHVEGSRRSADQVRKVYCNAHEGAQAQGLHDAAGLQRTGVIVMQIQHYLGAPDQKRHIGAPHTVACHMNVDATLLQLTQYAMSPTQTKRVRQ